MTMARDFRVQLLPESRIRHWGFFGVLPAISLPIVDPLHDALADILRVAVNPNHHILREERKSRDSRIKFHRVIRRMRIMLPDCREAFVHLINTPQLAAPGLGFAPPSVGI
jgi:hypothetical protein